MSLRWTKTKGDPASGEHTNGTPIYRQHPINTGIRYKANGPREIARRLQQRRNHV